MHKVDSYKGRRDHLQVGRLDSSAAQDLAWQTHDMGKCNVGRHGMKPWTDRRRRGKLGLAAERVICQLGTNSPAPTRVKV